MLKKEKTYDYRFKNILLGILNLDKSDYLVEFVLKLFLDAFVYMIRKQISKEDRIKEFKRMFRVLCSGVIVEASETKIDLIYKICRLFRYMFLLCSKY